MKKLSKLLLVAVLALGMGLTACNNEEVPDQEQSLGGNTWASISIAFPKSGTSTRATLPDNYNKNGAWKGRDKINRVDVYLVNGSLGTVDKTSFNTSSFNVDGNGVLQPNLAIKATAGHQIRAYVVVNDVNNKVRPVLDAATVTALNFADVFKGEVAAIASEVATADATKDVILMTNAVAPVAVSLEPGVSEADAKDPAKDKNLIKVNVERVVSRAIATQSSTLAPTIGVKAAGGAVASTLNIKKIEYAVGQSNKKFNILKDATSWTTPSPVYGYVPAGTDWSTTGNGYFDYAGLTSYAPLQAIASSSNADVITALEAENTTASKFVLPVTHADANYRKGNTTYFEIRVVFTPTEVDGATYTTYNTGDKLFLGSITGLFYSTREKAQAAGETVITQYKNNGTDGFITKYVTWLNPDKIPGFIESPVNEYATKSPTVRNQVYHVHVTGFKGIGVPGNPLIPGPGDPDDPNDSDNPTNPIDPNDPLENEDTYMSVQITVLDYTVHSYDIELGIDY